MVHVIGIEKVNYVSKKTNREVNGVKIYYVEDIHPDKGEGVRAENIFVKPELANGIEVDSDIVIYYNRYGSVDEIQIL